MDTYEALGLLIFLAVQFAFTFWYIQLMHLMDRTSNSFTWKHGKLMWICLLFALNLLGAIAYWCCGASQSRLPEARISR